MAENKHSIFYGMSDADVAGRVRMLMRTDLDHEPVCVAARDRIVRLSGHVAELQARCRDAAQILKNIHDAYTGEDGADVPTYALQCIGRLQAPLSAPAPAPAPAPEAAEQALKNIAELPYLAGFTDPMASNYQDAIDVLAGGRCDDVEAMAQMMRQLLSFAVTGRRAWEIASAALAPASGGRASGGEGGGK